MISVTMAMATLSSNTIAKEASALAKDGDIGFTNTSTSPSRKALTATRACTAFRIIKIFFRTPISCAH